MVDEETAAGGAEDASGVGHQSAPAEASRGCGAVGHEDDGAAAVGTTGGDGQVLRGDGPVGWEGDGDVEGLEPMVEMLDIVAGHPVHRGVE